MAANYNNFNQNQAQKTILSEKPTSNGISEDEYFQQLDADRIYGIDNNNPREYQYNTVRREQVKKPNSKTVEDNMDFIETKNINEQYDESIQNQSKKLLPQNQNNHIQSINNESINSLGVGGDFDSLTNSVQVTPSELNFLNGFIKTQIGRKVTVDFLLGTNTIISKTGFLVGVATDFIVLNEENTNDITTCDFNNIKFIRFYY